MTCGGQTGTRNSSMVPPPGMIHHIMSRYNITELGAAHSHLSVTVISLSCEVGNGWWLNGFSSYMLLQRKGVYFTFYLLKVT